MKLFINESKNQTEIIDFVNGLYSSFKSYLSLKEEYVADNEKIKYWKEYEDALDTKQNLLQSFFDLNNELERNDYIRKVKFSSSNSPEGLSNYIEITFNTPFNISKKWLKTMTIRLSDHPQVNKVRVENIPIVGKTPNQLKNEITKLIDKRIRRIKKEE